jgi:hypothetical protein
LIFERLIEVGVVNQSLPTYGVRFSKYTRILFRGEKTGRIFASGVGVVDGTGTNDHKQTAILAAENYVDFGTPLMRGARRVLA